MVFPDDLIQRLSLRELGSRAKVRPLSGGDINQVFKLTSDHGEFVLKLNSANRFPGMFEAEKDGLESLGSAKCFRIPNTIATGEQGSMAYLLMEYIAPGAEPSDFSQAFGRSLAHLHSQSKDYFGHHTDNYIGSLVQYNKKEQDSSTFFIHQRLEPQFKMALERGYSFNNLERFYNNVAMLLPDERSSLIHGDLWGGNYLISADGEPVLIDPAVAYGPREMDLAMMELFGGFPGTAIDVYKEVFPLVEGYNERRPLWQLYYLLVHLNLFGSGYLGRVRSIVDRFC